MSLARKTRSAGRAVSFRPRKRPLFFLGLDVGGGSLKLAGVDESEQQLIHELREFPSAFSTGPLECLKAVCDAVQLVREEFPRYDLGGVGVDYPGPSDRFGKIRPEGTPNSKNKKWGGFNLAKRLQKKLGVPVAFDNDANAAGRWASSVLYKGRTGRRIEGAVVGTGLGGFYVHDNIVEQGARGKAAEYGHLILPWEGIIEDKQPVPVCQCGRKSDTEAYASRSGLENWIAPWFLRKNRRHPLAKHLGKSSLAPEVRRMASEGDELARKMVRQQALALAALFNSLIQIHDPDTLVVGGGILEYVTKEFREWFMGEVSKNLQLDADQRKYVRLVQMPHGDQAAARGMALNALDLVLS